MSSGSMLRFLFGLGLGLFGGALNAVAAPPPAEAILATLGERGVADYAAYQRAAAPKADAPVLQPTHDIQALLSANGIAILALGILPQPLISLCTYAMQLTLQ